MLPSFSVTLIALGASVNVTDLDLDTDGANDGMIVPSLVA
mgnify:CR=1 FL=1